MLREGFLDGLRVPGEEDRLGALAGALSSEVGDSSHGLQDDGGALVCAQLGVPFELAGCPGEALKGQVDAVVFLRLHRPSKGGSEVLVGFPDVFHDLPDICGLVLFLSAAESGYEAPGQQVLEVLPLGGEGVRLDVNVVGVDAVPEVERVQQLQLEHILSPEVDVQARAIHGASEGLHAVPCGVDVQQEVDGDVVRLSGAAEGPVVRVLVDFPRTSPEQRNICQKASTGWADSRPPVRSKELMIWETKFK